MKIDESATSTTVIKVASHTFFSSHAASTKMMTDAVAVAKSPREKEKRIMKVKQHTIAGPRSPSTRNNPMHERMATNANEKNDHLLFQLVYSEMNLSLVAKNPARKMITKNFTASLG